MKVMKENQMYTCTKKKRITVNDDVYLREQF